MRVCKTENNYSERIVEVLSKAIEPMDIEKIRIQVGIGNWNTALSHCLQLMIAGKIKGQKTSKSWVFWLDKSIPNAFQEAKTQ
jgi:hypothetical protein